ncbi:unnamed protein product, partial [marine sediment metagenome]
YHPPPPDPPTNKWCILDIIQTITATGYKIVVITNVPCHLFMYWTNQEPLKHDRTRVLRGLTIPAASQYCFVDWEQNEQHEAGDTIFHTFIKEPWPVCETRWFVFRGKIGGEWSNSISCIFKKHRVAPPPEPITKVFYSDPHPEVTSVDGWARRLFTYPTYESWRGIHGGWGTQSVDAHNLFHITLKATTEPGKWCWLSRAILL